jgi:hypothetical protein
VDVVPLLVADREPTVLGKPRQCALYNPPVSTQRLTTLDPLLRYAYLDTPLAQRPTALFVIVGFVGVKLLGAFSRATSTRTFDGFYSVHKLFENHRVVDVGSADSYRERDAVPVRNKVALRARFSLIRRIRSGVVAPLLAGTVAESKEARSQSIWSASPNRSSNTRYRRSHTPASCHSRSLRQQVTPEPQPISWGSISQGMPLFSTKVMPVRAARSSTRGRPPLGLGGSDGSSGSMVSHSSSVTSSFAIPSTVTSIQGFERLT